MDKNIQGRNYAMFIMADPDTGEAIDRRITPVDRSDTIVTGGTAQVLMNNTNRHGYWVQNVSAEEMWISDVGVAAPEPPSLLLAPGAYYEPPFNGVPDGPISIYGATTGLAYSAREW